LPPAAQARPALTPSSPKTEPASTGAPEGALALPDAWEKVLSTPKALPAGVLPFLKAAKAEFPKDGRILITVLPGPGLERLADPVVVRALKDSLGRLSGSVPELVVVPESPGDRPAERITEGTVRNGRLKELVEKEPTLGEAVKELDLELLD
jgi:hypothetical protein